MIISVESTLPTFKAVRLKPGLNVLLSDKAANSEERQTRNSAGKTSFVEILHFLLGSRGDKDSLPRNAALVEHSFRGTFRLGGDVVTVERSGAKPSRILLDEEAGNRLGLPVKKDKVSGATSVSRDDWNEFLGHRMFGLPARLRGSAFETSNTPTFRSLFSYFARRHGSLAFSHPERQAEAQQRWDWQSNLSYLLGLDWRVPHDLHKIRERERMLEELKKANKGGALGQLIGTVAELRPQVVFAEESAAQLRASLDRFEVVDAYREMAAAAASAKTEMQAISRRAVSLRETLDHLRPALADERAPEGGDVARLYKAIGIELPETAVRRFDEVESFHRSVVANRRSYLEREIAAAEAELARGNERSALLDAERSEILRILQRGGALEDFVDLQRKLADAEAHAAALRERFKSAEALESESTQLSIDRARLKQRLQDDHRSSQSKLDEAILLIGRTIRELYQDRVGKFEVEATENGPEFRISIQGDRGGGIANMEVFCLDHALFSILGRQGKGPGFLVHDSHLFDGVDARQISLALRIGARTADAVAGQYVVALNSDIFDALPLPPEFDRQAVVLAPRLSDDETGGLFGFRFD